MTEISGEQTRGNELKRVLTPEQTGNLSQKILNEIENEQWRDKALANWNRVTQFVSNGIGLINKFEEATYQKHPQIHTDTDIVYVDSGPGPYSYKMLEPDQKDIEDSQYHKWPWSRKMDRARIRTAYILTAMITAKRIEEQTGVIKSSQDLTPEDFQKYGPFIMYASTHWQNAHIKKVIEIERKGGKFLIPDDKIIMYENFKNQKGEVKPIVDTADQIEGLHYPPFEGKNPPKRIVMVSHPAHLLRIIHILGKYPESIPSDTKLQLFPIPTPKSAGTEYTEAEVIGSIAYVFKKDRATLEPFKNFEI